jgi:uncharacterized membrane protein
METMNDTSQLTTRPAVERAWLVPMVALIFASVAGCFLLAGRVVVTGEWSYSFLAWNLFLAWIPFCLSVQVERLEQCRVSPRWHLAAAGAAWLFFYPNAPYIFTDFIHLGTRAGGRFWVDLVLILWFALTGLVLGFVSLFLMHRVCVRRFGRLTGWVFVALVSVLSGVGIYVGRFLRWNSWDVVLNPVDLFWDLLHWLGGMPARPVHAVLPFLFGSVLFVAYLILFALTQLGRIHTEERE